jgi:predicted PhzF superfamily epimerase YddE/YHI9
VDVRAITPDFPRIAALPCNGIIVTAPGDSVDFVSRYFAPKFGIPEDPVTGSAHCELIPYWAKRLGKKKLVARQISARGGELRCEDRGDRVGIAGTAVKYLEGIIEV